MSKLTPIIDKYVAKGLSKENIEFAIESVRDGSKRVHILENLTADYRGISFNDANDLLNDLFTATGGEFKKENRNGYMYGILLLVIGLCCGAYEFYVYKETGVFVRPILAFCAVFGGTIGGLSLLIKALRGNYRDSDSPFE